MPRNGTTGAWTRLYTWEDDDAADIPIRADRMDDEMDDMATGLANSLAKDGQTTPTANLPMGGFKHTGVAVASLRTDYLRASQAQDNDLIYYTTGGSADAYTLTPSPSVSSYTGGQSWLVKISAANLTTTPTIAVSGLTAKTIVNSDGSAVAIGDLALSGVYRIAYEATAGTFVLVNKPPAVVFADANNILANQVFS